MTGHLRQQIILYNHAKRLGDIEGSDLQKTIDDFNDHTRKGGSMRQSTRNERRMSGMRTGWVSIDSATEAVIKQEWSDERTKISIKAEIPVGARKVVDVNRRGRPIMMRGRRAIMTFEYRTLKGTAKPRWVLKTWKYAD